MKRLTNLIIIFVILLSGVVYVPGLASGQKINREPASPQDPPTPGADSKLFLPLAFKPFQFTISGKITDKSSAPVAGVTVVADNGVKTVTDAKGEYTLSGLTTGYHTVAPTAQGKAFQPAMVDVRLSTSSASNKNFIALADVNYITNPGFELFTGTTPDWWTFQNEDQTNPSNVIKYDDTTTAWTSTTQKYEGTYSAFLGTTDPTKNAGKVVSSYVKSGAITLPSDMTTGYLSAWVLRQTGEAMQLTTFAKAPEGDLPQEATVSLDAQYIQVWEVVAGGENLLKTLVYQRTTDTTWVNQSFFIGYEAWRGKTVRFAFGVVNDGNTSPSSMYVDNVALTYNGTPGPGPTPNTCPRNVVYNSDFELVGVGWQIETAAHYPATWIDGTYVSPRHSLHVGLFSDYYSDYNYNYKGPSEFWQDVDIPVTATQVRLELNWWPISTGNWQQAQADAEKLADKGPQVGDVWEGFSPEDNFDAQYLWILDPYTSKILAKPIDNRHANKSWFDYHYFDLDINQVKGKRIRILVGAWNDGYYGIAGAYVDDLKVNVYTQGCTPPTPTPTGCTELLGNNGFEGSGYWEVPSTAFSAGYSTSTPRTGSWDMRSGITNWWYNRYSFSDFFQTVYIPWDSRSATLTYYFYPGVDGGTGYYDDDSMYLYVLDPWGSYIDLAYWRYTWEYINDGLYSYRQQPIDLTAFRGMDVRLQWGTYNDGWGYSSYQFIDDVSLQSCK